MTRYSHIFDDRDVCSAHQCSQTRSSESAPNEPIVLSVSNSREERECCIVRIYQRPAKSIGDGRAM